MTDPTITDALMIAHYLRTQGRDAMADQVEVLAERWNVRGKMLRYIAFVLTGDETADPQDAADQVKEEKT